MRPIAFLAALAVALSLQAVGAVSAAASDDWTWPVRGDVVTPYRNGDDPYAGGQHRGIDIAAPVDTPVLAAVGGRVTFAGVAGVSGLTVSVQTADGRFDLSYLHLSVAAVHEGESVGGGDRIGAVGVSGRRSVDQPHLHFGIREAGSRHGYRNPLDFLPPVAPPRAPANDPPAAAPVPLDAPVAAPPATSAPIVASAPVAPSPAPAPAPSHPQRAGGFESGLHFAHGLALERRDRATQAHLRQRPVASGTAEHRRHAQAPHRHHIGAVHHSAGAQPGLHARPGAAPGSPLAPAQARPAAARHAGGGLDVGWLAALVGLLAAALCLSRPDASARVAGHGRARIGALLRPLGGRG